MQIQIQIQILSLSLYLFICLACSQALTTLRQSNSVDLLK